MATYQPERQEIFPEELRGALRAILMIDSVESKAAYALREPFIRTRVNKRCIGQGTVESGIKGGDLGDGSEFLFDESDAFEFHAIMKRRENGHALDGGFDCRSDHDGLRVVATTVDDAVPYHSNFRFVG